jgi:hypothetical protein
MLDSSYVYQIEDIIAEINRTSNRRFVLHAFWKYPIWENASACFKIHEKFVDPQRVMHLSVPETAFSEGQETKKLSTAAILNITGEIESFFECHGQGARVSESAQQPIA